jgi:hypothetical protein
MCLPEKQRVMGENGKKWVAQFAFDIVHRNFENHLLKFAPASE